MDMAIRRRLAYELLAADTAYHTALERHDRQRFDHSREAWVSARGRLERAMEAAFSGEQGA